MTDTGPNIISTVLEKGGKVNLIIGCSQRPYYILFDLFKVTLAVCCGCFCGIDLSDKKLEDISNSLNNHWRQGQKDCHDEAALVEKSVLKDLIVSHIGFTNEDKTRADYKGMFLNWKELISKEGFQWLEHSIPSTTEMREGCTSCFALKRSTCHCINRKIQQLECLPMPPHNSRVRPIFLYSSYLESNIGSSTEDNTCVGSKLGLYAKAASLQSVSEGTTDKMSSRETFEARFGAAPPHVAFDDDSVTSIGLGGTSITYSIRDFDLFTAINLESLFSESDESNAEPKSGSEIASLHRKLFAIKVGREMLEDKQRLIKAASIDKAKSQKDKAIYLVAEKYVTYATNFICKLPYEQQSCLSNHLARVFGDQHQPRKSQLVREFNVSERTTKNRIMVAAQVLKATVALKLAGHELVDRAIKSVIGQFHINDSSNINFQEAFECIALYFSRLASSQDSTSVNLILCSWAFRFKSPYNDADDDNDDYGRGGNDDEVDVDLDGTSALYDCTDETQPIVNCDVSHIHARNKCLLYLLKVGLGVELLAIRESVCQSHKEYISLTTTGATEKTHQRVAELAQRINVRDSTTDVEWIKNNINKSGGFYFAASIQRYMQELLNSRPAVKNMVDLTMDNERGLCLSVDGYELSASDLANIGPRVIDYVTDTLTECFFQAQSNIDLIDREELRHYIHDMIGNPCTNTVSVLSSSSDSNYPTLVFNQLKRKKILQELARASARDESALAILNKCYAAVMAMVWFTSSGVIRVNDLQAMDLGDPKGAAGCLFHINTPRNKFGTVSPLLYCVVVQKTQLDGVCLIAASAVKALLFYMQLIVPCYVEVILQQLFNCIENEATRESLSPVDREALQQRITQHMTRFPSLSLNFQRDARDKWKHAKGHLSLKHRSDGSIGVQLISRTGDKLELPFERDLFEERSVRMITRQVLVEVVRDQWLRDFIPEATAQQLRKLFVNAKARSLTMLQRLPEKSSDLQAELEYMENEANEVTRLQEDLQRGAPNGMHSVQTLERNYAKGYYSGAASIAVGLSEHKYKASRLSLYCWQWIIGLPSVPSDWAYKDNTQCDTILDHLCNSHPDLNLKITENRRQFLMTQLHDQYNMQIKDPEQLEAMLAVTDLHNDDNLLISLPCGMGKTISWLHPLTQIRENVIVLVVCPYRALLETQVAKGKEMGFFCYEWDHSREDCLASSFSGLRSSTDQVRGVELVCIVIDALAKEQLKKFLRSAARTKRLIAVVFDEVHQLVLSSNFRASMNLAQFVSSLPVPKIALTGTCPEIYHKSIARKLGINLETVKIISTLRDPNASRRIISVVQVDHPEKIAINCLRHSQFKKTLVFMPSKSAVESLKNAAMKDELLRERGTKILTIWSESNNNQNPTECARGKQMFADTLHRLRAMVDEPVICISTSILAEGVDFPAVDQVIIVGGTHVGLNDVIQMSSRTARGHGSDDAYITLLYNEEYLAMRSDQRRFQKSTLLEMFPESDQDMVRNCVHVDGIASAMALAKAGTCGRTSVFKVYYQFDDAKSVQEAMGITACGKCAHCSPDNWIYAQATSPASNSDTISVKTIDKENKDPSTRNKKVREFTSSEPTEILPRTAFSNVVEFPSDSESYSMRMPSLLREGDKEPNEQGHNCGAIPRHMLIKQSIGDPGRIPTSSQASHAISNDPEGGSNISISMPPFKTSNSLGVTPTAQSSNRFMVTETKGTLSESVSTVSKFAEPQCAVSSSSRASDCTIPDSSVETGANRSPYACNSRSSFSTSTSTLHVNILRRIPEGFRYPNATPLTSIRENQSPISQGAKVHSEQVSKSKTSDLTTLAVPQNTLSTAAIVRHDSVNFPIQRSNGVAKRVHAPMVETQRWEHDKRPKPTTNSVADKAKNPRTIFERAKEVEVSCLQFLQEFKDRCIACGKQEHGGKGPAPNHCDNELLKCPRLACTMCYQITHWYGDVKESLNNKAKLKQLRCLVMCREHEGYNNLKPCTFCWLVHKGTCTVSRHLVRSCFLIAWRRIHDFKTWLKQNEPDCPIEIWKDIVDFANWGVLKEYNCIHNVYQVVSFIKEYLSRMK